MNIIESFTVRVTPSKIIAVDGIYYSVVSDSANIIFTDLKTGKRAIFNTNSQVQGDQNLHIVSYNNYIVIGYVDKLHIFNSNFTLLVSFPDVEIRDIYIEDSKIKVRGTVNVNIDRTGAFTTSTDIIESEDVLIDYADIFIGGVKLTVDGLPESNTYAFVKGNLILLAGFDSTDYYHHYLIDKGSRSLLGVFDMPYGDKVGNKLVHRGDIIDPFTLRKKSFPEAIAVNFLGNNIYAIISNTDVKIVRDSTPLNSNFTDMNVITQ